MLKKIIEKFVKSTGWYILLQIRNEKYLKILKEIKSKIINFERKSNKEKKEVIKRIRSLCKEIGE